MSFAFKRGERAPKKTCLFCKRFICVRRNGTFVNHTTTGYRTSRRCNGSCKTEQEQFVEQRTETYGAAK